MSSVASSPQDGNTVVATRREDKSKRSKSLSKPSSNGSRESTRQESLGGAIVRALFGSLAFFFKRPIRLFRPVKLSSWTILNAMARREGRTLSLRYLRSLIKRERSFLPQLLLPPIIINTIIGFTLFEAYSITESRLLAKQKAKIQPKPQPDSDPQIDLPVAQQPVNKQRNEWTPLWIVTVSGAAAGCAQCFLSAPLDNLRYVLQTNTSADKRSARSPIQSISWRAVLRAAFLPFAPAIARDKLVMDVHNAAVAADTKSRATAERKAITSAERRQFWENRLKSWRGGVHGSGLVFSLIRDSVGFASFFFFFEVSRRCAFYASTGIDKTSAWLNAKGLGIVSRPQPSVDPTSSDTPAPSDDVHIESHHIRDWIRQGQREVKDADLSYNTSRTVQGRVVAVFILLIGGAIGALSYELVGRPFELARVVIFEGKRDWNKGRRTKPATATKPAPAPAPESSSSPSSSSGTIHSPSLAKVRPSLDYARIGSTTRGRTATRGARLPKTTVSDVGSCKRHQGLDTFRTLNTVGTNVSRIAARANVAHPRHPLQIVGSSKSKWKRIHTLKKRHPNRTSSSAATKLHESVEIDETNTKQQSLKSRTTRSLSDRPGSLTLLIEHAQRTAQLDHRYGGPDPSKTSIVHLLLHAYFVAPFLSQVPQKLIDNRLVRKVAGVDKDLNTNHKEASQEGSSKQGEATSTAAQKTLVMALASRRKQAYVPEEKMKKGWIKNNPVNTSLALRNWEESCKTKRTSRDFPTAAGLRANTRNMMESGARYWERSRLVWGLKRLATPYGVAFLVFAWLGGDLS